ncbi:response regulator transcription factor [Alistipes sp.]|uniref:response regulator transcription factor n=1 Tax=Alistipes sp. TaxID=1872444 RepID=UPI003A8BE237
MKILIVEDEPSLREIMLRAVGREGYVVETAATFAEADARVAGYSYDCILLDIMLPDGNGLRLLERIRELRKRENVIIISARNSIEDKVSGLELGADDYLAKPFHTAELLARIRSVLRRGRSGGELTLSLGNVSLAPEGRHVEVAGRELPLLKKEFDILLYFMQRPNHLVDKAVLAEAVWGDHADDADNFHFVYAQMKNLRRKLAEAGATVGIRSVYGFGYKLTPPQSE